MNLERAKPVSWYWNESREQEVRWLAEKAGQHQRIVEVGSAGGCTAIAMADNMSPNGVLYAVDTWGQTEEELRVSGDPDARINEFKKNMGDALLSGPSFRVRPVHMTSLAAAEQLRNERFDMIFIDAGHDYASIKSDIIAWKPLLSPGGLFCGHDFGDHCPDVMRAIQELVSDFYIGVGCIWVAR